MSFVWFRRYHKPFLWFAVIFTVVVFATFSGMGDLKQMLSGHPSDKIIGEFKVAPTGEIHQVTSQEFQNLRTEMNRASYMGGRRADITEDDVWSQLILLTDAKAAGLQVAEGELAKLFPPNITKEDYRRFWSDTLQFPSAHAFEEFMNGRLLVQRYMETTSEAAGLVEADEIYLRWRTDNELFDLDAVVIPDVAPESIADPAADELAAWWNRIPEAQRNQRFADPAKQDLIYGWIPLDAGPDALPDDRLAGLPEPQEEEVAGRWEQLKPRRWPDATEMSAEARAAVVRELKIVALAQKASEEFEATTDKSAITFAAAMTAAGLRVVDPQGELDPEGIKKLEGIGDEVLPLWLGQRKAGEVHFGYPYGGQNFVDVVYLESVTPSRPLTLDEAHEQAVKEWKQQQRDRPARDFREAIRTAARALPEVVESLKPVVEAAARRADEQVAATPDLDEAGKASLRKLMLDESEQNEILPRLAEFEHLVWKDVPLPEGGRHVVLTGVSRAYARKPDDAAEKADSIERFLKTSPAVFRLAVGAISEPLKHGSSSQSAVVAVTGRSFPDKAAMLADSASMEATRAQLAAQRQNEARADLMSPEKVKASHELKVEAKPEVN